MNFLKLIIASLSVIIVSAVYVSCKKETPALANIDKDVSSAATVQVFDATLKSARNFIYVDNVPISGAALGFGGAYPATAFGFKLAAGSRSFLIKDTALITTQPPLNFTQTLEGGKSYTVFMYDTLTTPKQVTVANNIVTPQDTTARLRFANFIYNTTAVPAVDVYSFRRGTSTAVFANVATNTVTDFIPFGSGITDTLYVYAAGTTSPLIVKSFVTSLTPTRSYTSALNGSYKGTKTVTTFATY